MHEATGKQSLAVKHLEHVVHLPPDSRNARAKLKALRATMPSDDQPKVDQEIERALDRLFMVESWGESDASQPAFRPSNHSRCI